MRIPNQAVISVGGSQNESNPAHDWHWREFACRAAPDLQPFSFLTGI
jgi:hypothetical protein